MIKQNTLFVLGAGASCPYNYPSGKELRRRICFEFVDNYQNYILTGSGEGASYDKYIKELRAFTSRFYKSSNKSIDLFLARNPKYNDIGKYAIALEILKAENESNYREEILNLEQDWYSYIYDVLTNTYLDNSNYSISENKVSFITFNYDRSFEYFLFESLLNSFEGLKSSDAADEIRKIPIIHVYGKVAPLPWEADDLFIKYKSGLNEYSAGIGVSNIKVMNEVLEDDVIVRIKELFQEAKKIFFLGFGYAKENLELFKLKENLDDSHFVYGSGLGLTTRQINIIKGRYFYPFTNRINRIKIDNGVDNLELLKQYL